MTNTIQHSTDLTIEDDYSWIMEGVAADLGYYQGISLTPQEVIAAEYGRDDDRWRNRVLRVVTRRYGDDGKAQADAVMALFDQKLKKNTNVT